eukprot:jgi/Mesvir1/27832/Mv07510-RA.1
MPLSFKAEISSANVYPARFYPIRAVLGGPACTLPRSKPTAYPTRTHLLSSGKARRRSQTPPSATPLGRSTPTPSTSVASPRPRPPTTTMAAAPGTPIKATRVRIGSVEGAVVEEYAGMTEIAAATAARVKAASEGAIAGHGSFSLVLSGGSLIKALGALASPEYRGAVDFSKWHVFWADERCVPITHEDSNYKGAQDEFLAKVPVPASQVHHIQDALGVEGAAKAYEDNIRSLVSKGVLRTKDGLPVFDMTLLGMGPDGHIASLFPGHALLKEEKCWVAPIKDSPKPPPERITLTLPVINASEQIIFVATGAGKVEMLQKVVGGDQPWGSLPAQLAQPSSGKLVWFIDTPAAAALAKI